MSYTLTFTGTTSILNAFFRPPLLLNDDDYVMGLTNFETYNSIHNVTPTNNKFKYGNQMITIPPGCYEISDINNYINAQLNRTSGDYVELQANNNTMQSVIKANRPIDFTIENSIGELLGFEKKTLSAEETHTSSNTINILKVNSLLVECSITTGNFKNGVPAHTIHQFFPSVPAGYKIIERPLTVIYLPINVSSVTSITLKILDQDGDIVNFNGEVITIGLHLKKANHG
uniref:Uncharacterized protein n=1 Tax=Photinus pyralis TaxID=7054 RepID=A0A1Y1M5S2_PHOPY